MRAGYSGLDLRKIENWDETKEKSWKRICLPPMKLKLSSQVTNIIKKIVTLANHKSYVQTQKLIFFWKLFKLLTVEFTRVGREDSIDVYMTP